MSSSSAQTPSPSPAAPAAKGKRSKQQNLKDMFQRMASNQENKEVDGEGEGGGDAKKPRRDSLGGEVLKEKQDTVVVSAAAAGGQLSPEQKAQVSSNRARAEMTLFAKKHLGEDVAPLFLKPDWMGAGWFAALRAEMQTDGFAQLARFVAAERRAGKTVYPPPEDVWAWTKHFDVKETKVVILGQDPYHGPDQAHGLCFSVRKGVKPPPSLGNMYKELESDVEGFVHPGHGDLTGWAKQGVLLLNACLTVRQGEANSHKDRGWERLTDAAISAVSRSCSGVVFLLWGNFAQKKASLVDGGKHHLLKSVHPSPLSAHRGFLGCRHFSKCNEILRANGKEPVDWKKLD